MYAEGFSKLSKYFNCVQRGHQQALETFPQYLILSLIGGYHYPIVSTAAGILWSFARWKWAEGYATGNPSERYSKFLSTGIWTSLAILIVASIGTILAVFLF